MFKKFFIPRMIQYFTVLFIGITLVFVIPDYCLLIPFLRSSIE